MLLDTPEHSVITSRQHPEPNTANFAAGFGCRPAHRPRFLSRDVEVAGVRIKRAKSYLPSSQPRSAVFPDPHRFDITNAPMPDDILCSLPAAAWASSACAEEVGRPRTFFFDRFPMRRGCRKSA